MPNWRFTQLHVLACKHAVLDWLNADLLNTVPNLLIYTPLLMLLRSSIIGSIQSMPQLLHVDASMMWADCTWINLSNTMSGKYWFTMYYYGLRQSPNVINSSILFTNEWCFSPRFCTCKAILGQGQGILLTEVLFQYPTITSNGLLCWLS